jgi:hypothetical protein
MKPMIAREKAAALIRRVQPIQQPQCFIQARMGGARFVPQAIYRAVSRGDFDELPIHFDRSGRIHA